MQKQYITGRYAQRQYLWRFMTCFIYLPPERRRILFLIPVAELYQPGKGPFQNRLYRNSLTVFFPARHKRPFSYGYGTQARRDRAFRVKTEIPVRHDYFIFQKAGRRNIPEPRQDSRRPGRRRGKDVLYLPGRIDAAIFQNDYMPA